MTLKQLEKFSKGGGPYIGPRGGKWADPKHTIPWGKDYEKPDTRGGRKAVSRKKGAMLEAQDALQDRLAKHGDKAQIWEKIKNHPLVQKLDQKMKDLPYYDSKASPEVNQARELAKEKAAMHIIAARIHIGNQILDKIESDKAKGPMTKEEKKVKRLENWPTIDHPEVGKAEHDELKLYSDNDRDLYRQKKDFEKNVVIKMAQGKYDSKQANQLWSYYADRIADKYTKEHGGQFNKKTRQALAHTYAREFEQKLKDNPQDYAEYIPKKYQKDWGKSNKSMSVNKANELLNKSRDVYVGRHACPQVLLTDSDTIAAGIMEEGKFNTANVNRPVLKLHRDKDITIE